MRDTAPPTQETPALTRENRNLRQENERLRAFISGLRSLMESAGQQNNEFEVTKLLDGMLQSALEMTNTEDGSLLVMDEDTNELVFVAVHGKVEASLGWRRISSRKGIAGWVAQNRCSTIVNDPHEDERFYDDLDVTFEFRTSSILAAPLMGDGKLLGVIEVLNRKDGQLFSTGDQELLTLFCRLAGELLYSVLKEKRGEG
uniref:Sigma-B regulation protein RsbU (Phosphoserine phosphatase) n=1 Tax=Candidatus Kentrum sp. FW TaxID=2126338 RepID=A0A450TEY3_9GAMM|nr:MAG: sigma-B regulation protein RsbU (phosphoserine phosphatase) [Candidatus Kentron sp. FW]